MSTRDSSWMPVVSIGGPVRVGMSSVKVGVTVQTGVPSSKVGRVIVQGSTSTDAPADRRNRYER